MYGGMPGFRGPHKAPAMAPTPGFFPAVFEPLGPPRPVRT